MPLAALVSVALAASAAVLPKPVATIEGVSEYRLPNGLRVLFLPDSSLPTTRVSLVVLAGSRHERYGERGSAHLFEHLLLRNTAHHPDLRRELNAFGATFNAETSFDATVFFERFPASPKALRGVLAINADRLREVPLAAETLAVEKRVITNELALLEDMPGFITLSRMLAVMFAWHNYGRMMNGLESDLDGLSVDALAAYHRTYYQPDNAVLILSGNFDPTKTWAMVVEELGTLPRPKRVLREPRTIEPIPDGERAVTVRRPGGLPTFSVAYRIPYAMHEDTAALKVLAGVLGRRPTASSCGISLLREAGYFACNVTVALDQPIAAAGAALVKLLGSVSDHPIGQDELATIQRELAASYVTIERDAHELASALTAVTTFADWRFHFWQRDRSAQVTAGDLERVVKRYLVETNRVTIDYVPTSAPQRAALPALPRGNLTAALDAYRGKPKVSEAASPSTVEELSRLVVLPEGGAAFLAQQQTPGRRVAVALQLRFGTETTLTDRGSVRRVLAEMLRLGATGKTASETSAAWTRLQAKVGFDVSAQFVGVSVEVGRDQLAETIDRVFEILRSPRFDAAELEVVKRQQKAAIESQRNDSGERAMRTLRRLLHAQYEKGHPLYVATEDETIAEIGAANVEQLRAFHQEFFSAQHMRFAAIGDCDAVALEAQLRQRTAGWRVKQKYLRILDSYVAHEGQTHAIATPGRSSAMLAFGVLLPVAPTGVDYAALSIANHLLGGGRLFGRLPARLRDRDGGSYRVETELEVNDDRSMTTWLGRASANPRDLAGVERAVREELARVADTGFTEAELAEGKRAVFEKRQSERRYANTLAALRLEMLEHDQQPKHVYALDESISQMTLPQLNAAVKRWLDPKRMIFVRAGDLKGSATDP